MTPSKSIFECTITCEAISRYYHHSKLACYVVCHLLYSFIVGTPVLEWQAGEGRRKQGPAVFLWCVAEDWWFWEEGLAGLHFCSVGNGLMYLWHKISDAASVLKPLMPWGLSPNTSPWDSWRRVERQIEIHVAFTAESVVFCKGGRSIYYK